ncbi:hypothetical protein WDZ92_51270, partial [Nostoc sp. NIES-2111]
MSEGLYGEIFADGEMAHAMGDEVLLQGMLSFESWLAHAQELERLVPPGTAVAIAEHCRFDRYDIAALGCAATLAGNPAIPLVKALTEQVAKASPAAARFVHYGATSQDVIDSGRAYQIENGLQVLLFRLDRLVGGLARLAPIGKAEIMNNIALHFERLAAEAEVTTPLRVCHCLAQAAHESDRFRTLEERGGAAQFARYEGRADLGN